MKRMIVLAVAAAVATVHVEAQYAEVTPYIDAAEMPHLIKCLPAPPDTLSTDFNYDLTQYIWGKQQRNDPERAAIARRDAVSKYINVLAEFSIPFGLTITPTETPEIWKLLETSLVTVNQMNKAAKNFYNRPRPFVRFHEHMLTYQAEEDEEKQALEGSYPSGHAIRSWTAALLLSEIAPSRADTILARGYMCGESRVIVGAHWQTDVDASRLGAVIGYMRLQTSEAFRQQMKKAQQEYAQKTGVEIKPSASDNIVRDSCDYYYTRSEMPDMRKFLPAPPDTMDLKFTRDVMYYYWGKTMRHNTERAEMARLDAEYGIDYICPEFSDAFGLQLSKEGTPEIYKLMLDATSTIDSICYEPKKFYMRKRPFMRMQETSLTPGDEASLSKNGSYPSGHTILGWGSALLLSEINPAKADTLIARGYQYGESRLIVGAHWRSDVDAGRLAASAAYARIHNSARFHEQMKKAKEEFRRLTGDPTAVRQLKINKSQFTTDASRAAVYDLQGRPVDDTVRPGVYISNQEKYVVR